MSFELIIGTTALLFFKFLAIFLSNLIEKLGLAASCINTFFGLYLFRNFKALKEESDLSFPPLIILIDLGYFFFFKCLRLFETIKIFLKSFELSDFSME